MTMALRTEIFKRIKWATVVITCLVLCKVSLTAEVNCDVIASLAKMVRATSPEALMAAKQTADEGYRAQVIFGAHLFELRPAEHRAALMFLNRIPKDDEEQTVWLTLGESLCDSEPMADMRVLGRLRDRLSRDLASAVLIAPEKLPEYIAYAITATQDPHNNYAVQMQRVCRAKHAEFLKSVQGFPSDKRAWLVTHVLDPVECRALALPEAE
jgi:hypothetical protein